MSSPFHDDELAELREENTRLREALANEKAKVKRLKERFVEKGFFFLCPKCRAIEPCGCEEN